MNIYVSYTNDCEEEFGLVKRVIRGLGLRTWEWGSTVTNKSIYHMLQHELFKADIFVGIYGLAYGLVAAQDEYGAGTTDGERSLVHFEYAWACERGIPMLCFFYKGDKAHKKTLVQDREDYSDKVERFHSQIINDRFVRSYTSLENLRVSVGKALLRLVHQLRHNAGHEAEMVYISHSTRDDKFVDELYDQLIDDDLMIWVDHKHMLPSADWDVTLEHALAACDYLIFVLSRASVASLAVKAEWSSFLHSGKQLYPVVIERSSDEQIMPFRLRILQYVDFVADKQKGFQALRQALGRDFLLPELQEPSKKKKQLPAPQKAIDNNHDES